MYIMFCHFIKVGLLVLKIEIYHSSIVQSEKRSLYFQSLTEDVQRQMEREKELQKKFGEMQYKKDVLIYDS